MTAVKLSCVLKESAYLTKSGQLPLMRIRSECISRLPQYVLIDHT